MTKQELKQQIIDAIANGKIQATTINIGDQIQNQQNYNIEGAGDIRIQIVSPDAPAVAEFVANHACAPQPEQPTEALCPYIQVDKLNEIGVYTPEQFNQLLNEKTELPAPELAAFLHKHEKSGYLNYGKHSKRQVFNTLHAYYPNMKKYSYPNFCLYF